MKQAGWKVIVYWSVVIAYIGFMFFLSGQTGKQSNFTSRSIVKMIEKTSAGLQDNRNKVLENKVTNNGLSIEKNNGNNSKVKLDKRLNNENIIIRKLAHFSEYFLLSLLIYFALLASGIKGKRSYILTVVLSSILAMSDEFRQSFVPGRMPLPTDVLIDITGSTTFLFLLFIHRKRKIVNEQYSEN